MFDVLTMAALADEFSSTIVGGRIQRIGLIDRLTVGMEIYADRRRRWLVASADTLRGRLLLTGQTPSLDPALITPFGLLLRKYARGATIVAIENPPLERLIRISIAKRLGPHNEPSGSQSDDSNHRSNVVADNNTIENASDHGLLDVDDLDLVDDDEDDEHDDGIAYLHLVVELMGRHSNLILVDDDGRIMESAKRVTLGMSRVRPIWPRTVYTPPPPVEKPDPRRVTAPDAAALIAIQSPSTAIAPTLVRTFRALSPQISREIAFQAAGDATATFSALPTDDGPTVLAREIRHRYEPMLTGEWSPRFYRDQETDEVIAFAAYPLGHLQATTDEEEVASISEAADAAEASELPGSATTHLQRRSRLSTSIGAARQRLQARLASLDAQQAKAEESEQLRTWGELIYGYIWQISPGQSEFVVDEATIPLDPTLTAKANAQAYFERYRKAQAASATLPALRAQTEHEIAYLDQLLTLIQHAHGFAEIEALVNEWESHRPAGSSDQSPNDRPKRRKDEPKRPKPLRDPDGNAVYIGHSGRQNDLVTFDLAGPDDTWLHARGVPGSHVVVRWRVPGAEEDPETIEAAAALAAYYSASRGASSVEVDVTKRKHVRKIKGAGPGMVTYRQERTIAVHPLNETAFTGLLDGA